MIIIEFGGNTLSGSSQADATLQKPEKPANNDSMNQRLHTPTTDNQETASLFAPLRKWIAENLWKN
jgi:hypothetical protein